MRQHGLRPVDAQDPCDAAPPSAGHAYLSRPAGHIGDHASRRGQLFRRPRGVRAPSGPRACGRALQRRPTKLLVGGGHHREMHERVKHVSPRWLLAGKKSIQSARIG